MSAVLPKNPTPPEICAALSNKAVAPDIKGIKPFTAIAKTAAPVRITGNTVLINPAMKLRIPAFLGLEKKFKNLPQGLRDIALGMGWINKLNPTLTLAKRIRRRLELHELSVKLGWPQTRSREELTILYNILKNLDKNKIDRQNLEELESLLDFH